LWLSDAVGAAFPNNNDLTVELFGNGSNSRFISNQSSVLLRAAIEIHDRTLTIVGSVNPDTTLLTKTPARYCASFRLIFVFEAVSLKTRNACASRSSRVR
jgi:hypothetical protein